MRLEELKNELPETPDFIHTMIQQEVTKQVKETNLIPFPEKRKVLWNMGRVAVAALFCILATSTVAYAGTRLYHIYIEKQGKYGLSAKIEANEVGSNRNLPEEVHDISISAGYIPNGMVWTDVGVKLSNVDTPDQGGISIETVLMDQNDLGTVMNEKGVVECEKRTFGAYDGVYLKYFEIKEDYLFNQRIYMLCPENYRVIIIYIGDDVSKEDAVKFAENLVITQKEEMIQTAGLYTWSDLANPEVDAYSPVTEANIPIHEIGDIFYLPVASGEDEDGNYILTDGITVCVDEVQITDDLQPLKGKNIPEEWDNVIGSDGKLVPNHLSFVKSGDGVETIDQVVKEETVNQKLVYVTVTYTNTSSEEINHVLYLGSLMTLLQKDDGKHMVYVPGEEAGEGYDYFYGDSVAKTFAMTYSSVSEDYGDGGNYIKNLKPGESIQINMAWIVNETDLNHLYLNLNGTGDSFGFGEDTLKSGVVFVGNAR